jgi:hypothetical protein
MAAMEGCMVWVQVERDPIDAMIDKLVREVNDGLRDLAKNLGIERNRTLIRFAPGELVWMSWDLTPKTEKTPDGERKIFLLGLY